MSITTVGDHLIHYEALGRGEPLVFVHGWLGSWRYWWPAMQELSSRHRTFALDLWGFGDSSKVTHKYSLAAYVEMLEQFLEKLGIARPIVLVGHGLGAAVALRFAQNNPQQVKRLALIALPVTGALINERLTQLDPVTFTQKVLGKANSLPELEPEIRKSDPLAVNNVARELLAYSFLSDLEESSCPTLLVFGDQDAVVQQPTIPSDSLGPARFLISLEGANHFPMLEQTARFNRLLLDFIHADPESDAVTPKEYWQRRNR
jgi:pimeloyl-ACP methyl ester carboxylesterase